MKNHYGFPARVLCTMTAVLAICLMGQDIKAQEHCGKHDKALAAFEAIVKNARQAYAPDDRDKTFDVRVFKKDSTYFINGSTTEKCAADYVAAQIASALDSLKVTVKTDIDLLPSAKLNGKTYGVICMSVASFNCDGDFSGESATQSLMGMPVKILEENDDDWYRATNMEGYTAWVITRSVTAMTKEEFDAYQAKPKVIVTDKYSTVYSYPSEDSLQVSDVVIGDVLIDKGTVAHEAAGTGKHNGHGYGKNGHGGGAGWRAVAIADGREGYIRANAVEVLDKWLDKAQPTEKNIVETAKKFTGMPYVWGGTSVKGIDCSGLAKTAYLLNGYVLRRDASQQCKTGDSIDVSKFVNGERTIEALSELRPGDLIFFGRKATAERKERVTHVGIYMGNGMMIHSSNIVRINSLVKDVPGTIWYRGSSSLLKARRIIGNTDCGKGIVSFKTLIKGDSAVLDKVIKELNYKK